MKPIQVAQTQHLSQMRRFSLPHRYWKTRTSPSRHRTSPSRHSPKREETISMEIPIGINVLSARTEANPFNVIDYLGRREEHDVINA